MPRRLRFMHACLACGLAGTPTASLAAVVASATPVFPQNFIVGQSTVPVLLELRNLNTAPDNLSTNTVCNAGDGGACAGATGILLTPSCGVLGAGACSAAGNDPGVFELSASALGEAGSACAGINFTVALVDATAGTWRFTPQPAGTHVTLFGAGAFCRIAFTVDVLKSPVLDANINPGRQTFAVARNAQVSGASSAVGSGSDLLQVARATPTLTAAASPGIELGMGQLADAVTLTNRVNAQPGATVTFQLYGPDDATCAAPPVFLASNVPYPQAGGEVASPAFTPTQAGTYRWRASYSGDANNTPVTPPCNSPNQNVTVTLPIFVFGDGFEN